MGEEMEFDLKVECSAHFQTLLSSLPCELSTAAVHGQQSTALSGGKMAHLALCLQPPATTNMLQDLQFVFTRLKEI